MATLTAPITGGVHGWPFAASLVELSAAGYAEVEYFIDGTAVTYRPMGDLDMDGRWEVDEAGEIPFTTRLLVRRPVDQQRFNGTVLMSWINVSAGFDIIGLDSPEILEGGFVVAAVSAQTVGIQGYDAQDPKGLSVWDPERYGALSIPSDDASYDVFTEAARLVGPNRPGNQVDPLAGLSVERIVAIGGSQSAARLHTYLNAVQPRERIFDGFLLDSHFGSGAPISTDGAGRPSGLSPGAMMRHPSRLRTDLGIPVMVVNTESETLGYFPQRQPDTDAFRLWEAAGTSHATNSRVELEAKEKREWGTVHPLPEFGFRPNALDVTPLRDAAVHSLHRWLIEGTPPPIMPPIVVTGEPPAIQRDNHGIAQGGIRLPAVEVPTASLRGASDDGDMVVGLLGSCLPFDAETLRALYPDHEAYVAAFDAAARHGVEAGFLLARDADRLIGEANAADIP